MENNENEELENNPSAKIDDYTLDVQETNLLEERENDEDELVPPEGDNEAKEINTTTIFGAIFIGLIIIIMLIMFISSGKNKNKNTKNELDKAGSKYEVEFKEKAPQEVKETFLFEEDEKPKQEDVDAVLDTLPAALQPQPTPAPAPVSAVGNSNYKSDRPDTRNSKSPRKIDGLKGQASPDTNQNIVSAVMNGTGYSPANSNQRMTKEEYIARMMQQTQSLQNQLYSGTGTTTSFGNYGSSNSNNPQAYQQNKEQFYSNESGNGGRGQFMSYNSLWDGTIISGALITAINTDNPGVVIARVTENVYSSYDHSFLLVPEGSLLYATYNSSVSYGQNKVQVAWNLLIRPDGYRMTLGNMNGVNAQGESGYKGKVNNHTWQTLKALGMVAIYSVIQTEIVNDINTTKNQYLQTAMLDVNKEITKMGNKIIDRALDIKPTITIKAGTEIKLITNTPLELPPVEINRVTRKYVRTR